MAACIMGSSCLTDRQKQTHPPSGSIIIYHLSECSKTFFKKNGPENRAMAMEKIKQTLGHPTRIPEVFPVFVLPYHFGVQSYQNPQFRWPWIPRGKPFNNLPAEFSRFNGSLLDGFLFPPQKKHENLVTSQGRKHIEKYAKKTEKTWNI